MEISSNNFVFKTGVELDAHLLCVKAPTINISMVVGGAMKQRLDFLLIVALSHIYIYHKVNIVNNVSII